MNNLRKAAQQALEAMDYMLRSGEWYCAQERADALRAALAQPEPFNPDWDRVKALEESLREHMAEIHRLKSLAQPEQEPVAYRFQSPATEAWLLGLEPPVGSRWEIEPLYTHPPQRKPLTEQEPVAHRIFDGEGGYVFVDGDPSEFEVEWSARYKRKYEPLYTAPPQRKPLTDDDIELAYREIWRDLSDGFSHTSVEWIEAGIRYAEKVHGIE